jgi:hypothetical protein
MGIMLLNIEYKNVKGNISNLNIDLPWLALIKHMAIAGQGHIPSIRKFRRILGMFFRYADYINYNSFQNSSFSQPPNYLLDPTEKAQFSNMVGKAIADFLSKRINNAKITLNYEAAMRLNGILISGKRPDMLGINSSDIFSIESKGLSASSVDGKKMIK